MRKLAAIFLFAFVFTGCGLFNRKAAEPTAAPTQAPTPTPAETQIDPADRPEIIFEAGRRAGEYLLTIANIPEDVEELDYIAIYMADRGESRAELGVAGTYYVEDGDQQDVYFGSCSSGTCNPDKNVEPLELELEYETEKYGDVFLRYPLEVTEASE